MDVNGTRFQLLKDRSDWARCRDEQDRAVFDHALDWDETTRTARLRARLTLFQRPAGAMLSPARRRGAAGDRFGNMYWISADGSSIRWLPRGTNRTLTLWPTASAATVPQAGAFAPEQPELPVTPALAGLAVTDAHYLVAGSASPAGLLVIDLEGGGEPSFLAIPASTPFTPFDLTPAPHGGVWVLDRVHRAYWGFDRDFRSINAAPQPPPSPPTSAAFHAIDGTPPEALPQQRSAAGFMVSLADPIAIAPMPDGAVLILDGTAEAASGTTASLVQRYRLGDPLEAPFPLRAAIDLESPDGTITPELSLAAHAIAYDPDAATLYAADRSGRQAIAFGLAFSPTPTLTVNRSFLPLHEFGGRALVAWRDGATTRVSYDVDAGASDATTRWAQLRAVDRPDFAPAATLITPVFDGKERDCVWDSVCIDACIPPGSIVQVASCTSNDLDQISAPDSQFVDEPALYLRGDGAEIPWYTPFPQPAGEPVPEGRGTWELLLQQARGRFLRLRLTISGNGRASPELAALRAWYPRFSYARRYLPAVYQDDPVSASFVERLLANPKGFYTRIEGAMRDIGALLDPRSSRADALDWLAGWVGLVFDPAWQQINQRRQTGSSAADRRRLFIRFATRLFTRRGTADGIRFALQLFLEPCLEALLARLRQARVEPDAVLTEELARLGLPAPDVRMTDAGIEDLLSQYLLSPTRPSRIRLIELFMSRDGRAAALGDPTLATVDPANVAHRFVVLVPETLSTDEVAMVSRIVGLEKPAHTAFETRRYWDGFRVGEARLGIDTALGEDARFVPVRLGQTALAEGYLDYAPPPMGAADRLVLNRDRLGALPSL